MRKFLYVTVSVLIGISITVGLCQLGYRIFDAFVVDDICAYHNQEVETSWLFDLFFPMSGWNGYHPSPGLFFYLTALACGIAAGVVSYRWLKRWQENKATTEA